MCKVVASNKCVITKMLCDSNMKIDEADGFGEVRIVFEN